MKRLFDICTSFIALIILLPVFVVIAILIKLDDFGPIFYNQKRIGINFKPFLIYKFRSMFQDSDKKGLQITVGGDTRVTRVGRILRKTKIDEIPQLINVLKGDMSFVGPRPEVDKYVSLYNDQYKVILSVRPGITDISSLYYRDEESILKNESDPELYYEKVLLPQKIQLAHDYINQASFLFDLKLIFITCYRVCSSLLSKK